MTKDPNKSQPLSPKNHSKPGDDPDSVDSIALNEKEPDPKWVEWFRGNSIPITAIISVLLVGCLISHGGSATGWTKAKDISDVLLNIFQLIGLLLGVWWFCFKFIKGRAFKESLIAAVSGRLIAVETKTFLVVNIRVKNVGQSVIELKPNASSLKLFGYLCSTSAEIVTVSDIKLTQFEALDENDRYIEPNEIVDETRFISIPNAVRLGLRLELEIINRNNDAWRTSSIVENAPLDAIIANRMIATEEER